MSKPNKNLKAYVRLDARNVIIPGSVQFRTKMPKNGKWKQLVMDYCCDPLTTTTTTTTTTTSTTTTTTTT